MARVLRLGWLVVAALLWSLPARAQDVECDPGEREVRSLSFAGNHAFSDAELALRINTTASSWARRHLRIIGARRCLNSGELLRDVYRLRLFYRNAGYYNAAVDTSVTPLGSDAVKVLFFINEGEPLRIVSFTITGLDSVPDPHGITHDLWTHVGRPFNVMRISADHDSIIARLRNSGYPQADVLMNYTTRDDSLIARVELAAVPGPRAHIGQLDIAVTPAAGRTQEISDRVVKKLLGVGPGDLYSDHDLAQAQRNLYQTGAYRFVQVAPLVDSTRPRTDSVVDLRVALVEDYMRDVNTEVGWATLDCFRTRAQVVDKNFAGGARRLELTGQLSKIGFADPLASGWTKHNLCLWNTLQQDVDFSRVLNYSANATLRQPTLFGTWATPSFSLYRERRSEYKAYLRNTYVGGELALLKALRENASLRLGYGLEYGSTQAADALLCAVFSRCDEPSRAQITRPLRLAILSATYGLVRTDSPLNPTSGFVLRAESRNSATFLGSDRDVVFAKGVGDLAWYHPLGFGSVFAIRLRGGVIGSGAEENGVTLLPPQERLYAGGASSVRGFQQNELGQLIYVLSVQVDTNDVRQDAKSHYYPLTVVSDRRVPVGGNSMLVGNVEWRLRDPFLPELLQWTLFTDVGQVWNRGTTLTELGFSPLWTPGVGVRLFTPIGPVQVNVGYNPYAPVLGPAFTTLGGSAGLYCVERSGSGWITRVEPGTNGVGWQPISGQKCNPDYQPALNNKFINKLTLTFSIGPEF
ncbi:MAG TPA: BamA/TamA family outer membrane protein [Gemmatimonadaceae bacterium]|nr:BamA/TamA family outer membrane protein [Gemmatimonadaceae bacterium]